MQAIGDEGYLDLTRRALEATDRICAGIGDLDGLALVAVPDSTLVAAVADGPLDVFSVCDEMAQRGWFVQPQLSYDGRPPSLHLAVSAATDPAGFLAALRESVAAALASGPVPVDAGVVELLRSLDPATLGDAEFDLLLAAGGLAGDGGELGLPERMAPVNALLDAAPPRLREAVLVAFLDRLARPAARSIAEGA